MRLSKGNQRTMIASALLTATTVAGTAVMSPSTAAPTSAAEGGTHTHADLAPLNDSGVHGRAQVAVRDGRLHVQVRARGLVKKLPHAQHIHFGKRARHECPTFRDDDNADQRLTTAEGLPAYGPVRVSLTRKGDTSPDSALAVTRFPAAPKGRISYERDGIEVTKRLGRAIRNGNAVVVVHGVDHNHNGEYDFDAGTSELDPSLPAEATDPATCGVLEPVPAPSEASDDSPLLGLPLPLPLTD